MSFMNNRWWIGLMVAMIVSINIMGFMHKGPDQPEEEIPDDDDCKN